MWLLSFEAIMSWFFTPISIKENSKTLFFTLMSLKREVRGRGDGLPGVPVGRCMFVPAEL